VPADEVSQAIGKRGINIKLASKLTGYEIDVYREIPADEEDIDIEEFADELEEETIDKLKHIGCDTGKAVLELSPGALSRRAEMDRETAEHVLDVIETEFEKGPGVLESIERGRFTVESVDQPPEDMESAEMNDADPANVANSTPSNAASADEATDAASDAAAESTETEDDEMTEDDPERTEGADATDSPVGASEEEMEEEPEV
jgi:N utilization substance protein A